MKQLFSLLMALPGPAKLWGTVILAGLLAGGVGIHYWRKRAHETAIFNEALEKGKVEGLRQAEELNRKAWDEREKQIAVERAKAAQDRAAGLQAIKAAGEAWTAAKTEGERQLQAIAAERGQIHADVAVIPNAELGAAIQRTADELDARQAAREAAAPGAAKGRSSPPR